MSRRTLNTDQTEFDGVFWLSQKRQNLTILEVSEGLGISTEQVRSHIELGHFVCGSISATDGMREHVRICRYSVVGFWRERQAEKGYEPPFYQSPETLHWREELRNRKQNKR